MWQAAMWLWMLSVAQTGERVRVQAAVVVASTQGQGVAQVLRPLERRLRTLLPYTSYEGFTEYTASLPPGESLELRLPDGRLVHLTPGATERPAASDRGGRRPIQVAVDRGADFESRAICGEVTVFQLQNGTADHQGDRTFLVFAETCPGEVPVRLRPEAP